MDVIKTSGGTGSPGYTDKHAPTGGQWQNAAGQQIKVPEGTKVEKTGEVNGYAPPFCEINILDGVYAGTKGIWVKSTHVVVVEDPVEPPVEPPVDDVDSEYAWEVDVVAKLTIRKVKVAG